MRNQIYSDNASEHCTVWRSWKCRWTSRFSKVLVAHSRGVACPTPPAPVSGHGALFAFSRALPHSAFLHRLFRWTASPLFTRAGIYGPHKSCPPGHAVEEKGLLGMISGQTEGWKVERGEGHSQLKRGWTVALMAIRSFTHSNLYVC